MKPSDATGVLPVKLRPLTDKPHITSFYGMGFYLCQCVKTFAYGRTPREAYERWFAWRHLGIYEPA